MAVISQSITRKIDRPQLSAGRLNPLGAPELETGPIPELETKRSYLFRIAATKAFADSNRHCEENS